MVSLYDLVRLQQQLRQITTGIATLDDALFLTTSFSANRVYDFQSSPGNTQIYAVCAQLILSQLQQNRPVVIVDLDYFPIASVLRHPQFKEYWLTSGQLSIYSADTFAKVVMTLTMLPSNSLVLFNSFHEMIEIYKHELVSAYEEAIYKHQLDICELPGTKPLPPTSDLIVENPLVKFKKHLFMLMSKITGHAIENKLIVFLVGHMDLVYEGHDDNGHLVLGNSLDYTHLREDMNQYIMARALFYKDWYHLSVHYRENSAGPEYRRFVGCVRVEKNDMVLPPIHFNTHGSQLEDLLRLARPASQRATPIPSAMNLGGSQASSLTSVASDQGKRMESMGQRIAGLTRSSEEVLIQQRERSQFFDRSEGNRSDQPSEGNRSDHPSEGNRSDRPSEGNRSDHSRKSNGSHNPSESDQNHHNSIQGRQDLQTNGITHTDKAIHEQETYLNIDADHAPTIQEGHFQTNETIHADHAIEVPPQTNGNKDSDHAIEVRLQTNGDKDSDHAIEAHSQTNENIDISHHHSNDFQETHHHSSQETNLHNNHSNQITPNYPFTQLDPLKGPQQEIHNSSQHGHKPPGERPESHFPYIPSSPVQVDLGSLSQMKRDLGQADTSTQLADLDKLPSADLIVSESEDEIPRLGVTGDHTKEAEIGE